MEFLPYWQPQQLLHSLVRQFGISNILFQVRVLDFPYITTVIGGSRSYWQILTRKYTLWIFPKDYITMTPTTRQFHWSTPPNIIKKPTPTTNYFGTKLHKRTISWCETHLTGIWRILCMEICWKLSHHIKIHCRLWHYIWSQCFIPHRQNSDKIIQTSQDRLNPNYLQTTRIEQTHGGGISRFICKWAAICCEHATKIEVKYGRTCEKMYITDSINDNK